LGAGAIVVVLLAGCSGGGGAKSAPPSTTATTATPSTTTPVSSSSSVAAPGVTSTTSIGRCTTAELSLRAAGGTAATGHALATFELRNTSSRTCRLLGYPGVQLLDGSGATLADAQRKAGFILGDVAPAAVTVGAGKSAYFGVESVNVCQGDLNPTPSASLRVTPPDETAPLTVAATINVCKGQQSVLVSPVRATTAEIPRH
jgi:hypothetical protein